MLLSIYISSVQVLKKRFRPAINRLYCTSSHTADGSKSDYEISGKSKTMVKVFNVAEKNDAAKSLADIMSRGGYRRREGCSQFNKIYEFQYNILNNPNCTMVMTSVSGHLLGYEFVGQYRKWQSCSPLSLFDAPVEKYCPENFVNIKRTLEREVRGTNILIIWTDGDREGENIGFEIINVCRKVKPNIRVYRAKFSEITPGAVQRACANLIAPDQNVSDAVDVRQELDLRIGAAFTRFQTLRLQKIFPEILSEQVISYGSCQFPTLGFVVERYKQVLDFVKEPFWKIKVSHKVGDDTAEFNWKRNRLFDHGACLVIYQHCLENPLATVLDIKTKPKSKWRPVALDTVELEKLASRKLKISAKETMKIAEKLYTQGFISYPRTETNMFPKDLNLRDLVQNQTQSSQWGDFANGILDRGPTPRNGNKTDNAHPPIHPTKYTNNLQGNEARIYEFIVRHFLACCSQDAQGMETTVDIDIADEKFTAQGLMITARNYLDVYPYDKWSTKTIPVFQQHETFQPDVMQMVDGETSPPPLLTEADLIALMEKHGIGTDATHAEHIEKIKERMYVGLRPGDGRFVPGELGMGLVEGYDAMGYEMSKPHLRAGLEADLKRICEGTKDKNVVLAEQLRNYKEIFIQACEKANMIDQALSKYFNEEARPYTEPEITEQSFTKVKPCPKCGSDMVVKVKKDGKGYFLSCLGYPQCKNAMWFPDFVLEATAADEVCNQCQPPGSIRKINFKFKRGSVPPLIPTEYVGCIGGCDSLLTESLNVRGQSNTVSRNNISSNDSGYGSSFTSTQHSTQHPNRSTNNHRNNGNGRTSMPMNGGGEDNPIVCNCGEVSQLLTVRKDGPNKDRQFYSCSKRSDDAGRCNFFLWADESASTNNYGGQQGGYRNNSRNNRAPLSNMSTNNLDDNDVVCNCGQPTIMLTVKKDGPNKGREFHACNKGTGNGGCNFFQWADQTVNTNNHTGHSDVQCGCGMQAKQLTVSKEGPNKGRQFYACSKPRGEGCDFFQWSDEIGNQGNYQNRGGGTGRGRGRGRGGASSTGSRKRPAADGGARKSRKCGLCGEEGHTRKTCPHR